MSFDLTAAHEQIARLTDQGWSISVSLDQPAAGEIRFRGLKAHRNIPGGHIEVEVQGTLRELPQLARDLDDICSSGLKVLRR